MEDKVIRAIAESISVKEKILKDENLLGRIRQAAEQMISALKAGHKILVCGNGGSAADAQHFAAELVGKFYKFRSPIPAIALTTNTSILTSVANDTGYKNVFVRQIEAIGQPGDILIAISTSGNSQNVLRAIQAAKRKNIHTIGLTGECGGKMRDTVDILINIPSSDTPRIQESHILILHIWAIDRRKHR